MSNRPDPKIICVIVLVLSFALVAMIALGMPGEASFYVYLFSAIALFAYIASIEEGRPGENVRPSSPFANVSFKPSSGYFGIAGVLALVLAYFFVLEDPFYLFHSHHGSSMLTSCISNLKNIGTSLEMYSIDARGRYPHKLEDLTPNYLKVIPTCSSAGTQTYCYVYSVLPDAYTVWCSGAYHTNICPPDYPKYDSIQGLIEGP